jgi:hypothetical protein
MHRNLENCRLYIYFYRTSMLYVHQTPWTKKLWRHQSLNVVFTGQLGLGWCSNFVGSKYIQKQSVKQNMVYNTTQYPPPPPHSRTLSVYTVCLLWEGVEGGGEVREEGRGCSATASVSYPSSLRNSFPNGNQGHPWFTPAAESPRYQAESNSVLRACRFIQL